MQHRIEHGPAFAWLRVTLSPGETVLCEAGSMVTRTPSLGMKTRLNSGKRAGFFGIVFAFFIALARKIFGGETLFVNEFGGPSGGEVVVAPSLSGHIVARRLAGENHLFVRRGSWLASTGDVDARLRFGGLRTLFGGEGLVLIDCVGDGDVFVNSYGGITEIPVSGKFVVDTGHIVAFEGSLDFKVRSIGGFKSFLFSGEGLVCEFVGKGTVFVQSRNLDALVGWISPLLSG